MKRFFLAIVLVVCCGTLQADIPSRQLDGSFSKQSPYQDPYPYTKLDFAEMAKNPLQVGVKKEIPATDKEHAEIAKLFEPDYQKAFERRNEIDKELRKKYVKTVRKEYELTAKEKATVEAYPDEFPLEKKLGKRVQVSQILKLGDKEYDCRRYQLVATGDWNGDKIDEIFIHYSDGVTHAGAYSGLYVFSTNGAFVWRNKSFAWPLVYDYDKDGKVEVVIQSNSSDAWVVLGCPDAGQTLTPFKHVEEDLRGIGSGPDEQVDNNLAPAPAPAPAPSPVEGPGSVPGKN